MEGGEVGGGGGGGGGGASNGGRLLQCFSSFFTSQCHDLSAIRSLILKNCLEKWGPIYWGLF